MFNIFTNNCNDDASVIKNVICFPCSHVLVSSDAFKKF